MSCENEVSKRKSRKKLIYQKILEQMEFYFSPANLSKDRWLSNKLEAEQCICLTEFLRFNKIKALTEDVRDLGKALRKSDLLTVSEDMKVRPSQPLRYKENEEDYVIYVEQVPPDADHDWIREIFSHYGEIDYISIPRFKNSNKCKGFAFIEFSKIESAQIAMQDFKAKGCYLSTDIAPEDLLSIANYEPENGSMKGGKKEVSCAGRCPPDEESSSHKRKLEDTQEEGEEAGFRKRKLSESEDNIEEASCRKRKLSESEVDGEEVSSRKRKLSESEEERRMKEREEDAESEAEQDSNALQDTSETEETGKIKKKKNRKKNKKKKNKDSSDNYGLQILTKRDWKRLRNKYLNMQKEKMKQLKKHLYLAQKKGDAWRQTQDQEGRRAKGRKGVEETASSRKIEEKEFVAGIIVKISLEEPLVEVKKLKTELKKNTSIQYVDAKEGDNIVHVRFESPETASEFVAASTWEKTKILKGQKEAEYWEKLQEQRNNKFTAKVNKKGRGKEKLMKKAEHILGKHIIFDDIAT